MKQSSTPILDAIRASKSKKLDKKYNAGTYFAKRAIAMGEAAKSAAKVNDPDAVDHFKLSYAYYSLLSNYQGKPNYYTYTPSKKSDQFWLRVLECKNQTNLSCEEYIKAQFVWFSNNLHTFPPLVSLATPKAVERALTYTGAISNPIGRVEVKAEKAEILSYYDKQIRDICRAQKLSKEQFYEQLVKTGEFPVPQPYLDVCPIWQRIKDK